ncbi:Taurine dioxygenase, alpha-ketoglutarate-dependent [Nocardia amikacinitolerans]|nr:Taurine dioxygenase, alpha-ketoglutarate-dependent [Nocardia amikacinitolerans]
MLELGNPVEYNFGTKLSLEPRQDSDNVQFTERGMRLHADSPFNAGPPVKYIGMYCVAAPDEGGESLIAMCDAFFQQAPDDLLDTMHEILVEYRNRIADYYKDHPGRAEHPRVKPIQIDPDTGRRRLVIGFTDPDDPTRTHDAAVVGYSADESAELLRRIEAELHKPAVLYTHKWRAGEVMVLDNRRVLHGRAAFPNQTRKIVRLSVA